MADHAVDDFDEDIFIYRGGQVPQHVTHVLIDRSLDEIEDYAFKYCKNLLTVETHDGIRKVGKNAFRYCTSLRRINLKSAIEIDEYAFNSCDNLESVEFGDRLETIGDGAFGWTSLKHLKLPSIVNIGGAVFLNCTRLIDVELSDRLETIGAGAFCGCERLQRIAVPLTRDLFDVNQFLQRYNHFDRCEQLTRVDIVGEDLTKTAASLHMESWRTEMVTEINRINQVLSSTSADEKTFEIQLWMNSVLDKMDHYKAEHYRYVKEGITLLELALWKAKLDENEDSAMERESKKALDDFASARKEKRITCGADMVIKNVLPFLQLE